MAAPIVYCNYSGMQEIVRKLDTEVERFQTIRKNVNTWMAELDGTFIATSQSAYSQANSDLQPYFERFAAITSALSAMVKEAANYTQETDIHFAGQVQQIMYG